MGNSCWDGTSAARSPLADRAVKGRATGLDLAPHGAPAARLDARLAFATIDGKFVLETADTAIGLFVVAQRRATGANGIEQHAFDGRSQALRRRRGLTTPRSQACGTRPRVQPGAIERFTDVDIAETSDNALVHKERLEVRLFSDCPTRQIGRIEFLA